MGLPGRPQGDRRMGVDPAGPPRAPSPAAAKGAAEAQKLEVDSSRRPVDGNQRYQLSSRSQSPMNMLADGGPPPPAAQGEQQKTPALHGQVPVRLSADVRVQTGPPAAQPPPSRPALNVPGAAAAARQSQTTPRRNVPIVHTNLSPHSKLPPPPRVSAMPGSPQVTGMPRCRSMPIVHATRSPSPRKPDNTSAGNAVLMPHSVVIAPRSKAMQQGDREQNRNPNAQMEVGAAKDLRGKMSAAMHAGQGGGGCGGDFPGNAPARMHNSQPGSGRGQAGHQQVASHGMPLQPPPLRPFSCFILFRPMPAVERRISAFSIENLGDEHLVNEFHRDDMINFPDSIAAAPSPIRGLDGSSTIIHQGDLVNNSGDWENLAEASSTFIRDSDEHVAEGVQRGMAQTGRSTVAIHGDDALDNRLAHKMRQIEEEQTRAQRAVPSQAEDWHTDDPLPQQRGLIKTENWLMGTEATNIGRVPSEQEPGFDATMPASRATVSDPGVLVEGLQAEKEELRMENLNLRQRVLELELGENALQKHMSALRSQMEARLASASPADVRDRSELVGERDEGNAAGGKEEASELHGKIQELVRELAREVERGRERDKEREESQAKIRHLEETVSRANAEAWGPSRGDVCRVGASAGWGGNPHKDGGATNTKELQVDQENTVIDNAHMALRECEISSLRREVEKRDKKIADLTRGLEALEMVKNGRQLADAHAEVQRLQATNDELRQKLFEANVSAAREENRMQDLQRALERSHQQSRNGDAHELVALRARRKELQRSLDFAHVHASELAILAADACIDFEELQNTLGNHATHHSARAPLSNPQRFIEGVDRGLSEEDVGGGILVAAAHLMLDLSMSEMRCDAATQTSNQGPEDVLGSKVTSVLEEDERTVGDVMRTYIAELETRCRRMENTLQMLEEEKSDAETKCMDLQLMCVAYREKIQGLERAVKDHEQSAGAKEKEVEERDAVLEKLQVEIEAERQGWQAEKDNFEQERQALRAEMNKQQVALEAEEEALRLKHNELHLKSAAAQQECQRTVGIYEEKMKARETEVADGLARIEILTAEIDLQNEYRRELRTKVKELEARASESRPQHVAHDNVRSELATDAYLGFQGTRDWELESVVREPGVEANYEGGMGVGGGGVVWVEVAHALQEGRDRVRTVRVLATELEAACASLKNEAQGARERLARLEKRLLVAERARVRAETAVRRDVAGAEITVDPEKFRALVRRGDVNELIAVYQMLQEQAVEAREAAAQGAQALEALRAQRVVNVELEAQLWLAQEAKASAESEIAVAQRVMSMRAAIEKHPHEVLPSGTSSSPLAAGLANIEQLLYSVRHRISISFRVPRVSNHGPGGREGGGGPVGRRRFGADFEVSTDPMPLRMGSGAGGRRGDETDGQEGVDPGRGQEAFPRRALSSSLPPSLLAGLSLPPTVRSHDQHTQDDVPRAHTPVEISVDKGGLRMGRRGSPASLAGGTGGRYDRADDGARAGGGGSTIKNWGSRSSSAGFGAGLSASGGPSAWYGGMGGMQEGGEAWQRTMEIRKILGK